MKRIMMRFPDFKPKALTLSYDDNVEQDETLINILDQYGIKCTFNVSSALLKEEKCVFPKGRIHRRLTKQAAVELYKNSSHEVAIHTAHHLFTHTISPIIETAEIFEDRKALEALFDFEVRGMAYPYGQYNDSTIEIAKNCGIAYARTTQSTYRFNIPRDWLRLNPTCHHADPALDDLTQKFINTKVTDEPLLFYLWGHSFEFEGADNWEIIETFAKKISTCDEIWHATNIEIHDYVEAFRSLRFTADGSKVYNPTCTTIYLYNNTDKTNLMIQPNEWIKL